MNSFSRGVRNAFRNVVRTVSIVVILGLVTGLALSMLIAKQAVGTKISTVKSSVGNTVSISPAGARGFAGGGNALTEAELAKVAKLAHVSSVSETLSDRLDSTNTNLTSAVNFGSLGQRFMNNGGSSSGSSSATNGFNGGGAAPDFAARAADITVIGTDSPTDLSDTQGGGTFKLTSGKIYTAGSSADVAVVGSALASKNSLNVGSTFTAYSSTMTVVGIYDAGNTFSNNQLLMPLKTVQSLSGQTGSVTSATATVDSVTNVSAVTKQIQDTLGSSTADVTNSVESAQTAVSALENIQTISLYSLIGAVAAGAVIILLTMIMIVRERRREIGVIKAIGASNLKVMTQFMTEAVTLTVLGAILGIAVGVVTAKPITNMLVSSSTTSTSQQVTTNGPGAGDGFAGRSTNGTSNFANRLGTRRIGVAGSFVRGSFSNVTATVGWSIVAYGLGVAVIIALAGSAAASFFIAKVRPAEVLRAD